MKIAIHVIVRFSDLKTDKFFLNFLAEGKSIIDVTGLCFGS